MKTSAENISNSILQSIDIVLQERIKELAFDKTLICTIIDDRDKKNGKYQVTDGSIKFWAYSSVDTYSKDEQVRVSVANGDMTQDKYIIGKYIANNDVKPISFVSPLEKVLDISDNLIADFTSPDPYGLAANGLQQNQEGEFVSAVKGTIINNGVEYLPIAYVDMPQHYVSLQQNKIYDTLYMQADFKTLLNSDVITTGTFGLAVILNIKNEDGSDSAHTIIFDNSKMFGNPYNFALYSRQQAKFDLTSLNTITGMEVYLFQANNFVNYKGEPIVANYLKPHDELEKNILATNIVVGLGADLSKHADNTLKLYSNDSIYYTEDNITSHMKSLAVSWYNKSTDDKYIGFSDGIISKDQDGNIIQYDEREHIQQIKTINRLNAQKSNNIPLSEDGLNLAWEIKYVKPKLDNISYTITKTLCPILTNLYNQTQEIKDLKLDTIIDTIDKTATDIKETTQSIYDEYMVILKRGSYFNPKSETIASTSSTSAPPEAISITNWITENEEVISGKLVDLFDTIKTQLYTETAVDDETKVILLKNLYDKIYDTSGTYKEFQSIYDKFKPCIEEVYKEINDAWIEIQALLKDNYSLLKPFAMAETLEIIPYNQTTYIQDAENRYAIYWYRKSEDAPADEIMPAGWSLISTEGLPSEDHENKGYLAKVPENDEGIINVELDGTKKSETFKVILFYNHERIESNELIFTNTSELKNKVNSSLNNVLSIKHGALSKDVYQEYGMSNSLMNIADRYKKRMLSVDFALSDGAVDNLQLVGTQIFWYVPNRATMLTYDLEDIENLSKETIDSDPVNPFINDIPTDGVEPIHSEHYRDGYTCFYKTICKGMRLPDKELAETDPQAYESQLTAITATLEKDIQFCYRIRDYYVPSFSNNMICCKVIKDDIIYEAEISFTFASYGTSGTDYTLVITPAGRQAAVTDHDNLLLDVMLFNGDNEQIAFQREGEQYVIQDPPSDIKIEYKDDNKIAQYTISASDNCHQGILAVQVKVPYSKNKNGEAVITAYYPIAWATNKDYYMEGGSMVVYNSQGVNPIYYKDPYRLFTQAYKDTISIGDWGVHYWDGSNPVDPNNYSKDDYKDYQVDFNFLPVMQDNKLIPSNMYIDFTDEQKVWTPYVCCTDWYQPILIIQNKYGLPMLNNWDGSLQIDEKNGTILASMIGAGRKTENNTFEGVLMGDIQKSEGDDGQDEFDYNNKQGLGIYGFNDGAQSFGFNVDGTAFMGKSGRGRILFDGNSGQISSASYQATRQLLDKDGNEIKVPNSDSGLIPNQIAKAGMMIDLDDGRIDMLGVYSTINEGVEEYEADTYGADHKDRPKDSVTPELAEEDQVNIPKDFDQRGDLINPSTNPEDANKADWNPQQVHISLDSRARNGKPYFRLTDIRGKDLIYAGDKHLFIKSSNYIASPDFYLGNGFAEPDKDEPQPGYGMKIDLYQGLLDAYNLRITSRTFFVDSRKNAKANLIVKDSYTGKNLIYMGVPSNTSGEYPTDKNKIANQWYFQSGNYKEAVVDEEGAGMKIDLGLGLIDAYNFKLTSKNVLIDSTKDAKVYFEIKAQNTVANALQTIFQVNDKGATLAGWTVDKNSIRIGTLGVGPKDMTDTSTEHSMWLCSTGTGSSTSSDFVGGAGSGWCLTIGRNFGINKAGEMFGRGVTIKDGDITIVEENTENIVFSANRKGELQALMGVIGKDIATGQISINGHQIISGDTEVIEEANAVYFMRDNNYNVDDNGLNLSVAKGGIANNNFYLGTGGLVVRPESIGRYSGVRLTGGGLWINGCRSDHQPWCGTWVHGEGISFYDRSNIFGGGSQAAGTIMGSLAYIQDSYLELNSQNTDLRLFSYQDLGISGKNITLTCRSDEQKPAIGKIEGPWQLQGTLALVVTGNDDQDLVEWINAAINKFKSYDTELPKMQGQIKVLQDRPWWYSYEIMDMADERIKELVKEEALKKE